MQRSLKIFFGKQVYNVKDTANFKHGGAEHWDKAVSVETLVCSTQQKMNFVIPFVFQVFPELRDAPGAPASWPVHIR